MTNARQGWQKLKDLSRFSLLHPTSHIPHLTSDAFRAILVGLLALILYGRTLAPGVVALDDDTLEFQVVALRGAIPHPTGYPLYAMLLALAARLLPFGEVAFRANLVSALAASGAVALTFLVGRRLGARPVAAGVGAMCFALAPTFWAQATVAEVYALHALLVAALGAALLRVGTTGTTTENTENTEDGRGIYLLPAALVFGLGMAHHRTMALWLPAALLHLALAAPSVFRPGWHWARLALAALAPLLLYVWLPLRAAVGSVDGTYQQVGFGCWVTACQYAGFFADNALAAARPPAFFAALTWAELGALGMALASLGTLWLWGKSRAAWALLVGGGMANAAFAMLYRVPDPEVFWLPVVWALAVLAAAGAEALLAFVAGWVARFRPRPQPVAGLLAGFMVALLLLRGAAIFPVADRSAQVGPPLLAGQPVNGRDMLAQPLPQNAVIVGLLGEIAYLRYLQGAEALPAIATDGGDSEALRWQAVERALAAGQRPFLTRPLAGVAERWSLSALGPLVEVLPTPQTTPPAALWPLDVSMGESVTLVGWTRSPIVGSDEQRLTVAWRVAAPIGETLHVSARLVAADGRVVGQQDQPPLDGAYPTPLWRPGEVILDTYTLPAPPPGARYLLILYRPTDGSEVGRAEWMP